MGPEPRKMELGENTEDPKLTVPLRGNEAEPAEETIVTVKRETFVQKFKAISVDNPPTSNPVGYTNSVLGLLCCTIPAAGFGILIWLVLFAVVNCIPIASIVIGSLYYDEQYCPPEKIAIFLIVGGAITLLQGVMELVARFIAQVKGPSGPQPEQPTPLKCLYSLVHMASLGWFIGGCVIVFRLSPVVTTEDTTSSDYCHPVLYYYAYWMMTISCIVLCFSMCCLCCACLGRRAEAETNQ